MLQAANISVSYKTPVLSGVSVDVAPGTLTGVAGKNGSGKSTLLNCLASLHKPDAGQILLDGAPLTASNLKGRLGFVPQENAFFDRLSVRDNLNFWASAAKIKYTSNFFDKTDLKKKVSQLSGGMKKRLSIEIALIPSPDYLILDEPTAALDIVYQKQILDMLLTLKAAGKGIIFTTHYADELKICDNICVLRGGNFVYTGAPDGLPLSGDNDFKQELFSIIAE